MSLLDVSEIFDDEDFAQEVQIMRMVPAKNDQGEPVETYPATTTIRAIVHPTKPDDMQRLPEGERYLPSKKIMSADPLLRADIVFYQCDRWRVSAESNWCEYGYYNCIAIRHAGTQGPLETGFVVT